VSSITVWGRRSAFNVQKVLWTLDELGLQYEHRNAGGSFGGLNTPEFLAMNPHGRVPVLVDGALTVWESHSIVRYLAATYGPGSLWPPLPAARSFADRWMDWSATTLQPDFMKLFWGYYRMPENQRDLQAIKAAVDACNHHFGVLAEEPPLPGWNRVHDGGHSGGDDSIPLFRDGSGGCTTSARVPMVRPARAETCVSATRHGAV
jgi:glutathione S-transferase